MPGYTGMQIADNIIATLSEISIVSVNIFVALQIREEKKEEKNVDIV